jgi:methyltransferase (TIGR00027 family)
MQPHQPSRTLLRPALHKAAHQLLDDPCIFQDPLAVGLFPECSAEAILAQQADLRSPEACLLRSVFVFRSRFAEDSLAEAVNTGVGQFVILGAGLETFPWRQPLWAQSLKIFVSDHPASAVMVRDILKKRNLILPSNVNIADSDLEQRDVLNDLAKVGFNANRATFVAMLGLSQYLTPGTMEHLLRSIASLPRGSRLILSFAPPQSSLVGEDSLEAGRAVARSEALGEPWLFRPEPRELHDMLNTCGFSTIRYLAPEIVQQDFFGNRNDGLRAAHLEQLMDATV